MSRTSTSQTPSTNTTPACDGTVQSHSLRCLWRLFGSRMPDLQALALNVYSQPISQSTVKQLFSIYDGIMGPKRNKLFFATQIPNAMCVPVSDFGAGTRIFAYLRVPTKIVVVHIPKPFFMLHHTTKSISTPGVAVLKPLSVQTVTTCQGVLL